MTNQLVLTPTDQTRQTLVGPVAGEIVRAYGDMREVDELAVAHLSGLPLTAASAGNLEAAEQFGHEALRTRTIARNIATIAILESKKQTGGVVEKAKVAFELMVMKHITSREDYRFGQRTGLLDVLVGIANGRKQTLLERYDAELAARQ